jgi:hypothetical protein
MNGVKDVSDEYGWRQLGSAVNAVLLQVKTKAIRNGSVSNTQFTLPAEDKATAPPHNPAASHQPSHHFSLTDINASQFLSEPALQKAELQAEHPFEMKQSPKRKAPRSSRNARLF